ncbi:hypothetical protein EI94DRAFT_1748650 [Lactarius quietus]|nr:hypothetical protein EI94DRAFT_1748650 [Lactarius quietus]
MTRSSIPQGPAGGGPSHKLRARRPDEARVREGAHRHFVEKACTETHHFERLCAGATSITLAVYAREPVWHVARRRAGCVPCTRQGHLICVYPVRCVGLVL